jgi:hydroxymethylbilane synthase
MNISTLPVAERPDASSVYQVPAHFRALPLNVGTRASPLALAQTRNVIAMLQTICPALAGANTAEIQIRTTGDSSQASGCRLADIGGKGLFSKEIDEAMLAGRIDIAVHSLKDLETVMRPGIVLGCVLKREDARDVLILGPSCGTPDPWNPWACLPQNAVIGTASVRRQAQLLHARPDLTCAVIRGNVATRLDKVEHGTTTATLLAYAGLRRLGLAEHASLIIHPEFMVPAAGQGIVGITVREDDTQMREMLAAIEDREARACAEAERGILQHPHRRLRPHHRGRPTAPDRPDRQRGWQLHGQTTPVRRDGRCRADWPGTGCRIKGKGAGGGVCLSKRSRFFEKKRRKKLLVIWAAAVAAPRSRLTKVFLLLFLQKKKYFRVMDNSIMATVIEVTTADLPAELARRGIGSDERVIVTIEPAGELLPGRRESRMRVVAAGLTDADIDRLIKDAQRDVTLPV